MVNKPTYEELLLRIKELESKSSQEQAEIMQRDLDLKQKENAMRESEERYRTLTEKTSDWIWEVDLNGVYIYTSPKVKDLLGYESDEIIGKTPFDFMPVDEAERVARLFQDIIRSQEPFQRMENTNIHKDGRHVTLETSGVPIFDADGNLRGYRGVDRDITKRKQVEEEKDKLQAQFQQAQKMEAIGTLAGGLAHDFNNLLMGIQGRVSLMSLELDTSHPHSEHINAIEEYVLSATELTRQLLGFARGGENEIETTDINELVTNSAAMFGRTKREIQIHTKLYHPSPVVEVDRRQIEQVLLNMYVNAWQAMSDGGELYLETRIVALNDEYCKPYQIEPGRYAKLSVTDTGIGMDEATCQRVFDPFFTTRQRGHGTGLGLASAYGIVKSHCGLITVSSQRGEGTTFDVYLPVSNKDIYQEIPAKRKLIKGSECILLVDDEKMIIDVGRTMLEKLGYRVISAQSGRRAVEAVKEMGNGIDLVILDMIMPGMDGGETFNRIREIQPELPVMLSSGYSIKGQAQDILRRGCNGFIQKPFNIFEFSKKVRKILDEAKS